MSTVLFTVHVAIEVCVFYSELKEAKEDQKAADLWDEETEGSQRRRSFFKRNTMLR